MMVFLMIKFLKCLQVIKDVYIGLLRLAIIPLAISEFIIVMTMLEVDIGLKRLDTSYLSIMEFIILVLMVEVELCLKIIDILPLTIVGQDWTLKGEVDIGFRLSIILPITQVAMVDC